MKIQVKQNNLYTTGYINEFSDGTALLLRRQIEYVPSENDSFVALEDGIDLQDLAYDKYLDSKNWWILGDVNKVHNPFELESHPTLIIPDLAKLLATLI